jgi:hypothetical protein
MKSMQLVMLSGLAVIICAGFGDCSFKAVGIKEVGDGVWLATFMHYDLGYFDLESKKLEPLANPFGPRLLPMSSV